MALAAYAKERLRGGAGSSSLFPEQTTFKEFAVRVGRNAREAIARRARAGRQPGLPARPRLPGLDDALLVAVTEKRTVEEIDRLVEALSMKLIYEKSQAGPARPRRAAAGSCRVPEVPAELRRAEPPRLPELAEPEVLRHFTELSTRNFGIDTGFYPLGSCTMKYNPRVNERLVGLPGFATCIRSSRTTPRRARSSSSGGCEQILREVTGLDAVSPPARRRQPGRAHRADAHARVLRRPRRGRAAAARSSSPTPRTARTRRA